MVKPYVSGNPPYLFYWNLSANVGVASPNLREDVDLVQFAYSLLAVNPKVPLTPADRAIFAAVVPGAQCTGTATDPLIIAIRRHQALRGGTQDGHVSVMPPGSTSYPGAGGNTLFMLQALNLQFHDINPTVYPRLDLMKKCPSTLAKVVGDSMLASYG